MKRSRAPLRWRTDTPYSGPRHLLNRAHPLQTLRMSHVFIATLLLGAALGASAQQAPQKPARRAPPPPTVMLPPATTEQFAAAALAHIGPYACETGQSLQLVRNLRHEGYVDLLIGKQIHTMKPILSSTGVLRLEDVRGRLLLLQIALKSMLLDVRSGRRLADDCVHGQQAENRRSAAALLAAPGLGIDLDRAESAAAAADAASASASAAAAAAAAASAAATAAPAGAGPAASASGVPATAEPASAAASGAGPGTPPAPGAKP